MDIFLVVLTWPLLLLVGGFVCIALWDSLRFLDIIGPILVWPIIVVGIIIIINKARNKAKGDAMDVEKFRRGAITGSLAVFIPIFVRYLIIATDHGTGVKDHDLGAMIFALMIGFGTLMWSAFIKNNKVVATANMLGGGFAVVYTYIQFWGLGQGARVIVAAIGLVIAVIIASIKLKDKLS